MRKYYLLELFLSESRHEQVILNFEEIEHILGFPLPHHARSQKKWWGNTPYRPSYYPKPWQRVGFNVAEADLANSRIVFARR